MGDDDSPGSAAERHLRQAALRSLLLGRVGQLALPRKLGNSVCSLMLYSASLNSSKSRKEKERAREPREERPPGLISPMNTAVEASGSSDEALEGLFASGPELVSERLHNAPNIVPAFIKWLHRAKAVPHILDIEAFLEWCLWICTGRDPKEFLQQQKELLKNTMCGKVWHSGAFAYRCETCQTSESSAICMECFQGGKHEGHDYRLYQSIGGGSCDCGIADAWKPSGFCATHAAVADSTRAKSLRQVTRTLAPTLRTLLEIVGSTLGKDLPDTDKAQVIAIVRWLIEICRWGDEARQLMCEQFVQDVAGQRPSPADMFLDNFSSLSEGLSTALVDLMVDLLLHNSIPLRTVCLRKLLARYTIYAQDICKEEDRPALDGLLHRWGLQLLTFREPCLELAKTGALFGATVDSIYLILSLCAAEDPESGCARIDLDERLVQDEVALPFVTSLDSAFAFPECAALFLRFSEHYTQWLRALRLLQGTFANRRREDTHVEYESESFLYGMFQEVWMTSSFTHILAPIVSAASPDLTALRPLAAATLDLLLPWITSQWRNRPPALDASSLGFEYFAEQSAGIPAFSYDAVKDAVYFSLPLHRWLAALLHASAGLNVDAQAVRTILTLPDLTPTAPYALLLHPLRLQLLVAQVRAGLWMKNGADTMRNQIGTYHSFASNMLDLDIVLLQALAILIGPTQFVLFALSQFGLAKLLARSFPHSVALTKEEAVLAEDLLALVLKVVTSRTFIGVDPGQQFRAEVVHWLACSDLPASKLLGRLSAQFRNPGPAVHDLDRVLQQVAVFQSPKTLTEQGLYRLKPECWAEFNPYFVHFKPSDLQKAEENYKAAQQSLGRKQGALPICVGLPPTYPFFRALDGLLSCPILHHVLYQIFLASLEGVGGATEALLTIALHFLVLALDKAASPAPPGQLLNCAFATANLLSNLKLASAPEREPMGLILLRLSEDSRYREQHALILPALERMRQADPELQQLLPPKDAPPEDAQPANKKQARERQQAMLAALAAQRQQFLDAAMEGTGDDEEQEAALEPGRPKETLVECSLCRESQPLRDATRPMALLALAQRTRLIERAGTGRAALFPPAEGDELLKTFSQAGAASDHALIAQFLGIPPPEAPELAPPMDTVTEAEAAAEFRRRVDSGRALSLHSCSHVVHVACHRNYVRTAAEGDRQLSYRDHLLSRNEHEFFCPVCRRLGNVLVPLIPDEFLRGFEGLDLPHQRPPAPADGGFSQWLASVRDGDLLPALDDPAADPFRSVLDELSGRLFYVQRRHEASSTAPLASHMLTALSTAVANSELALRGEPGLSTVLEAVRPDHALLLRSLYKAAHSLVSLSEPTGIRQLSDKILSALLQRQDGAFSSLDLFNVGVHWLVVHNQALFPNNLFHLVRLLFLAHLVQLSLSLWYYASATMRQAWSAATHPRCDDRSSIVSLPSLLCFAARPAPGVSASAPLPEQLIAQLRASALPFLRRCALFLRHCVDLPTPALGSGATEFDVLMAYLGLGSVDALLSPLSPDHSATAALLSDWFAAGRSSAGVPPPLPSAEPFRLVALPRVFQELVHRHLHSACAKCGAPTEEPALCLICGEVVRKGKACCGDPSFGGCFVHSVHCNAGQGAFLVLLCRIAAVSSTYRPQLIKSSAVLLIRDERVGLGPSPYLDQRGEEDVGLKRGRALMLNDSRYKQLETLMVQQLLDEYMMRSDAAQVSRGAQKY